MRSLLALPMLVLPIPLGELHAQRQDGRSFPSIAQSAGNREVDPAWLAAGGALLGAASGLGTAWAGASLTARVCEDCAIVGAVYGLVTGISAGIPVGVHLTNRSRGSLAKSLLVSMVIGAAGLGLAHATDEPAIMFTVPVLQLVSSVAIERGPASDTRP